MKPNRAFTDEELNAIEGPTQESAFDGIIDNLEDLFNEDSLFVSMFFYFYTMEKTGCYSLFDDEVAICFALYFIDKKKLSMGMEMRTMAALFLNFVQNNITEIGKVVVEHFADSGLDID